MWMKRLSTMTPPESISLILYLAIEESPQTYTQQLWDSEAQNESNDNRKICIAHEDEGINTAECEDLGSSCKSLKWKGLKLI